MLKSYRQSRSLAAQRDILLVELMKMHAPSCEPTVQAGELPYTVRCRCDGTRICADACYQVDPSNASIENASPEFWKNRIAMPSINERSQDEARKHKNSLTDVMVASDTEEESDSYEPSDVLTDCLDDEVAQRTSGSMIHHQVKSADHTVPADTLGREKPQRHAMWDVQATECKQYDKSASDWVGYRVGDHVAVGTNADGQKKKRQRTEE
jgi:hypothetical protein